MLLQVKAFREMLQSEGANTDPAAAAGLSRAGLCGMLRVTLPFLRILSSFGVGLPSSGGGSPISGSAKLRSRSLIFPGAPLDGLIHCPVPWDSAGSDMMICCNFGYIWLQRD